MATTATNPKVDALLSKASKWQKEVQALRAIILDCQLTEELKWDQPCYTYQNKNIVLIGEFRDYCALLFCKGVLLKDSQGILQQPGKYTQAGRLIKFTQLQDILGQNSTLKAYINEAIAAEKAGLKVAYKKNPEPLPQELRNKLAENLAFKTAFKALTPGRQRAYILFFSAPKQSATRESRIAKFSERILQGKGMNDCTCGLSQKLPACDGSHKNLR